MTKTATALLLAALPALAAPAENTSSPAPTPTQQAVGTATPAQALPASTSTTPAPTPAPASAAPETAAASTPTTPEPTPAPASAAPETAAASTPTQPDTSKAASPATDQPTTAPSALTNAYQGIVKIEVAKRKPDYARPWMSGRYGNSSGTGFMIGDGLFMTNAHVVANAERIYLSPYTDARKIPARVKFVAHDCDLALLEIEDTSAFTGIPCLEFSDHMPQLEDTVRAIGYPIGGARLSVTRGIVSRIDTIPYAHPRNEMHLAVQIDAAVNPGNSGGPILMGDKVVGVAFQGLTNANSTGYMIPIPVIKRFLQDIADGRYDSYVDLGASFFPLENEALRHYYGLKPAPVGVVVSEVLSGSSADGVLEVGDVVMEVNGRPVDSSAMIMLDGQRVQLEELAERAFKGDQVSFNIQRRGEPMTVTATLHTLPGKSINLYAYDEQPRYVQYAGLIFQPLNINVALAHHLDMKDFIVEVHQFINGGGAVEKQDLVLLSTVLRDEVNARLDRADNLLVTKVNGVEVKGLRHLYELLYPENPAERPPYTVIELKGTAVRPIVIDNATIDEANTRISKRYGINAPARL